MKIHPRLFAFLALSFVIATMVGTLSHELGHVAVAKVLGYDTQLHYASMDFNHDDKLLDYYEPHQKEIMIEGTPENLHFKKMLADSESDRHKVSWGGPVQTMLTGTIGFMLLWFRRKKIAAYGMKFTDWLCVFLAFFWSRQLANFILASINYIVYSKPSVHGDEARLSLYYNLPWLTLNAVTATIAGILLIWVVFFIIPKLHRLTFIAAGIAGSALGYMIWMYWIGPVVLP